MPQYRYIQVCVGNYRVLERFSIGAGRAERIIEMGQLAITIKLAHLARIARRVGRRQWLERVAL